MRGKKLVDLGGGGSGVEGRISRRGVQLAVMVNDTGIFPNLTIV